MGKKITNEDINCRLKTNNRKILLVGEYVSSSTKTLFRCEECLHEWSTTPNNITSGGSGCPKCNNGINSPDGLFTRLIDSKIKLLGEYSNSYTPVLFCCDNGHEWLAKPSSVVVGATCAICERTTSDRTTKTQTKSYVDINGVLVLSERNITCVGDYMGDHKKTKFTCSQGHEWDATPNNVLRKKSGCPTCATHGFDPNKPAWTYILIFDDFIKYGITNNIKHRLYRHTKNGNFQIAKIRHYENGKDARLWENQIKRKYGGKFVTKELCPDGWTESLPLSLLDIIVAEEYNKE